MSEKPTYEELEKRVCKLEQAELERKKTEEDFAQIFSMSLDMICIADINTATFIKVNPAFTEILGHSEEALLDKSFLDFVHPDDTGLTRTVIEQKLKSGAKINFENRYRCSDGSYRWLSWLGHPNINKGIMYAIARDITESKQKEEELKKIKALLDATGSGESTESEWSNIRLDDGTQTGIGTDISDRKKTERESLILKTAIDQAPVGIALADENLQIYYCNPEGLGMRGGKTQELVEIPKDAFHNWQVFMLNGEPYETDNLPLVRAINTGSVIREEFIIRHQDGTDHICDAFACPVLEDNLIIGGMVIFLDITERKKAEDSLAHSEERLTLVLKGSNDAPWDWDMAANLLYFSPQWWFQIGYVPDELPSDAALWQQLMHPDDTDRVNDFFQNALKNGTESYEIEFRLLHKKGHYVPVLSRGFIQRDENGIPIRVSGTNMDLSERKKAENALATSNRGLRVLKEAGKALLRAEDELSLIKEICRIIVETGNYSMAWVGYAEETPEKRVKHVGSWGISADYLNNLTITWGESATGQGPTGKAIRTQAVQIVNNILTDADDKPWRNAAVKKGFRSSIALPISHEQICLGALNIYSSEPDAYDESEVKLLAQLASELAYGIISLRRKKAHSKSEDALRISEEKYRRLTENSPDMIYRMSLPDGEYEYVSPAATIIFGYPLKAWYDNAFLIQDIIHPDWHSYFKVQWEQLLKGQIPPNYEYQIVHKNGEVRWVHQRNVPVKDADGCLIGIEGIVTDITERKQAEKKLKQYSEHLEEMAEERTKELHKVQEELILKERLAVIGHFAGSISHELRNPLAVIDSSVYLLKMKLSHTDEKISRHLEFISRNVNKSTSIIQSLLNLSRMEKPKAEKTDLTDLVSETLRSAKIPAAVKVGLNLPDRSPLITVEAEQIRMALKNIIKNAVQAMNGKGKLTISAQYAKSGRIELTVSDTGPGIAYEHIEKVFEPLFSTKTHGIGFGLSITKMIVENHGGTVRAESEPGSGAVFVLNLPHSQTQ